MPPTAGLIMDATRSICEGVLAASYARTFATCVLVSYHTCRPIAVVGGLTFDFPFTRKPFAGSIPAQSVEVFETTPELFTCRQPLPLPTGIFSNSRVFMM